jgi:hypothetical protein
MPSIVSAFAIGRDYLSKPISFSGQIGKENSFGGFNQRNDPFHGETLTVLLQVSHTFS